MLLGAGAAPLALSKLKSSKPLTCPRCGRRPAGGWRRRSCRRWRAASPRGGRSSWSSRSPPPPPAAHGGPRFLGPQIKILGQAPAEPRDEGDSGGGRKNSVRGGRQEKWVARQLGTWQPTTTTLAAVRPRELDALCSTNRVELEPRISEPARARRSARPTGRRPQSGRR
jgi:hypothetical protein